MNLKEILSDHLDPVTRKREWTCWMYRLSLFIHCGNITKSARWAGVSIRTMRNFVNNDPDMLKISKDLIDQQNRAKKLGPSKQFFIRREKKKMLHDHTKKEISIAQAFYNDKMAIVKKRPNWITATSLERQVIEENHKTLFGIGDAK